MWLYLLVVTRIIWVNPLKVVKYFLHFITSSRSNKEVVDLKYVMWLVGSKQPLYDFKIWYLEFIWRMSLCNLFGEGIGWGNVAHSSSTSFSSLASKDLSSKLKLLNNSLLWQRDQQVTDPEDSSFTLTLESSSFTSSMAIFTRREIQSSMFLGSYWVTNC